MKATSVICGLLLAASVSVAQNEAQWTLSSDATKAAPGATVPLRLTAKIDPGWHIYSMTTPKGGGNPTAVVVADDPAIESYALNQPKPERKFDSTFGVDVETFADQVVFLIPVQLKKDASAGALNAAAQIKYQVCSDRECKNAKKKVAFTLAIDPSAVPPAAFVIPAGYTEVKRAAKSESPAPAVSETPAAPAPSPD